jgi:hypothetical protein
MIELNDNALEFWFPEVHPAARLRIEFQRTLRIPDNDKTYPLPPGLGRFPLRHLDNYAARVPREWLKRGGVMLPMYQSEAMWINFDGEYPFAVKIATGKINAVSGQQWKDRLNRNPQDYVVATEQPWLDGYCVEKGVIRQFVAMPMGADVTTEEQVTGKAEYGGLQIIAYPMRRKAYEKYFSARQRGREEVDFCVCESAAGMGLAPGGRIKQEIYEDEYNLADWDLAHSSRCFVHICNSMVWQDFTGEMPPTVPPTARQYNEADLPWFDYYDEKLTAVKGSTTLKKLKSVAKFTKKNGALLPENTTVSPGMIVPLYSKLSPGQVREWAGR